MHSLTPTPVKLISYISDGEDARHFSFCLLEPSAMLAPQPGQFFMLHVPGVGAAPFTFTQPPDDKGVFRALVRRMGSVTQALFDCGPGSILGARGPFGKGWEIDQLKDKQVLIVAGGCGLAPLVSLTDYLIEHEYCEQLALLYGSRSAAAQVLNPERARWQRNIAVYDVVEETDNSIGLSGTPLDALEAVLKQLGETPNALLLCGPERMMHLVAEEFVHRGLEPQKIWLAIERRMHCAVGLCGHCYLEHEYACTDGPTYRWDRLQPLVLSQASDNQTEYHC